MGQGSGIKSPFSDPLPWIVGGGPFAGGSGGGVVGGLAAETAMASKRALDASNERPDLKPVAPTAVDPNAKSIQDAAAAQSGPRGRAATILTGGQGLSDYQGARRTLMGS